MSLSQLVPWKRGLARNGALPFNSLRDEVNRAFDAFFNDDVFAQDLGGSTMVMSPKLDLTEDDRNVQLTMELPGLTGELREDPWRKEG
jgi:HSP20 family molecular chaperone IbpA